MLNKYTTDVKLLLKECFNSKSNNLEDSPGTWFLIEKSNKQIISCLKVHNDGSIWNVATKSQYRKKGLATKLLNIAIFYIINSLNKNPSLIVDNTKSSYDKLIKYYETLGFKKVKNVSKGTKMCLITNSHKK